MKKLLSIMMIPLMLGACATVKPDETAMWGYKHNSNMSEALNVATATGLNNKATPMKDNAAPVASSNYKPSAMRKVATVATVAGSAVEGIMTAGSAALNIASILQPTDIDKPQQDDYAWVFLPASKASNIKDAASYVRKSIMKAMYEALAKQGFNKGPVIAIDSPMPITKVATFLGGKCNNDSSICGVLPWVSETPGVFNNYWAIGGALVNNAPYFAPTKKVWFFRANTRYSSFVKNKDRRIFDYTSFGEDRDVGVDNDRFWRDVTKQLSWLWIYHGTWYAPKGPVVYHNGKALRFIKPAAVTQKTAAK